MNAPERTSKKASVGKAKFDACFAGSDVSTVPQQLPQMQLRRCSGDRFWGQVWGSSGSLRAFRGRGEAERQNAKIAGKTRREAGLLRPADEHESLHGKEGVDGSSPSEGLIFIEIPANRQVVLSP
jgi:hypothetical protein